MKRKMPARMAQTTATKFRMPKTLSRVWTFASGRTAPQTKMTNETIRRTNAMMADQVALALPLPKVPAVPETSPEIV